MTTIYIIGNGAGIFNPASTVSAKIECWGAGQGGATSCSGGGYSAKNSFSLTAGTQVPFFLGSNTGNTGDCWFNSNTTVIANGGGSSTSRIGDTTFAGGAGGVYTGSGTNGGGGGGAGGPNGAGNAGGNTTGTGGGGGGGNGGGGS